MKKKEIFKIIIITILSLIAVVLLYFTLLHFNGFLNKDNIMTRDEVIALLKKGEEYSNYYYSPEEYIFFIKLNEMKTEYYIKDGIVKCVNDGKAVRWENYNTDEIISIMNNYASISSLKEYYSDETTMLYSQRHFHYSIIADERMFNTNFEYLGERRYKGRSTILVKIWNKDTIKANSTIFYIDKDTGLIMRRIDFSSFGLIKSCCNRNVKLDIVTDKDVERLDLEGYEILKRN